MLLFLSVRPFCGTSRCKIIISPFANATQCASSQILAHAPPKPGDRSGAIGNLEQPPVSCGDLSARLILFISGSEEEHRHVLLVRAEAVAQ